MAPTKADRALSEKKAFLPSSCGNSICRDALYVIEGVEGATPHVAQRVVASRAAIRRERIEQEHLLPGLGADAGRGGEVLLLHVEADEAGLVQQAVGDHEADALAGAGRRVAGDVLRAAEAEVRLQPSLPT